MRRGRASSDSAQDKRHGPRTAGFWIAVFALIVAVIFALSDAPVGTSLALALVALIAGNHGIAGFRSQNRAFRRGRRLKAGVKSHYGNGSDMGAEVFAREWRTGAGHFGMIDYVSGAQLIAVGKSITVAIDPLTHRGWWVNT
ncbi:MAG: hypothetical protein WAT09_02840 [Paracoccaceae bacterium]